MSMMPLWISGGRLLDPCQNLDENLDLLLDDRGRVEALLPRKAKPPRNAVQRRQLDATGLWILPGLIDLHVHLRQPGRQSAEDITSGTRAAAAGGFTRIVCMPNTQPVLDQARIVAQLGQRLRADACVHVHVAAALSLGLKGRRPSDFSALQGAGASVLSDDGRGTQDPAVLAAALDFGLPVMVHAEDHGISAGGQVAAGKAARVLNLTPWPARAESHRVRRDLSLLRRSHGQLHFQHLSTLGALRALRQAKDEGLRISAEITPHHLSLTTTDLLRSARKRGDLPDTNLKMNPPLRGERERQALRGALEEGLVDVLATDHAPHHRKAKAQGFAAAPFGVIGLETALPLSLELHRQGVLSASDTIALWTRGPARVLGVECGLRKGRAADFCLVDPEEMWVVDPNAFFSQARNTPFAGWPLRGRVKYTFVAGVPVHTPPGVAW